MSPEMPAADSTRMALARVAGREGARMPGVALTAGPGQRWVTIQRGETVPGVVAVAEPHGLYELGLHVIVAWPPEPLARVADELRDRVLAAAEHDGLGDRLGRIEVCIEGVQDPDDPGAVDEPGAVDDPGAPVDQSPDAGPAADDSEPPADS